MESARKICNMNCCVYGCHSRKDRSKEISFHTYPKSGSSKVYYKNKLNQLEKIDRKKAWDLKLRMGKPSTSSMRVCSLHFTKKDFITNRPRRFPRLKTTAVPSQNLPTASFTKKSSNPRPQRLPAINHNVDCPNTTIERQQEITNQNFENDEKKKVSEATLESLSLRERHAIEGLLNLADTSSTTLVDRGVQVKSGDILTPFISIIDSAKKLNSLTGLNSFEQLEAIVTLINKFFPPKRTSILTVREKIILVFMKLKTAVTFAILACFFKVTNKSCKRIFSDMIAKLSVVLKPAIYWPSSDNAKKNIAKCFTDFDNVRVILDCTEIPLQRPKCLCCRVMTYSHYYSKNTVKYMTGIGPSGLIIFISDGYGGRASDKIIFEQSNLIDRLDKGTDSIMVDKGYLIEDITSKNFIKLIRPPFLREKSQFTKEEARLNAHIAKARVHIERSNQRIKLFDILNKKLPWSLIQHIDEIFTVICAIVNLSSPILADDKF